MLCRVKTLCVRPQAVICVTHQVGTKRMCAGFVF